MEVGILGDPGVHAILERRKEQDAATTQSLNMEEPIVLALQVKKLPAQVPNLAKILGNSLLFEEFLI